MSDKDSTTLPEDEQVEPSDPVEQLQADGTGTKKPPG